VPITSVSAANAVAFHSHVENTCMTALRGEVINYKYLIPDDIY
jgi:hypothetical protein